MVVLGLRGQGQSRHGHDGAGPDVDGVARAMVRRLPRGTTLRVAGVPYPARPGDDATYDADVSAGVGLVRDRIASLAEDCTHTRVVLVGYSQGAEVVHRLVVAHPRLVRLAVLMGDPARPR